MAQIKIEGQLSVILFSGGRESLLNLHKEAGITEKEAIRLVLYDYGQKSLPRESEALDYYASLYSVNKQVVSGAFPKLNLAPGIKYGGFSNDHVVGRNLLFLIHAVNLFYSKDYPMRLLAGFCDNWPSYNDSSTEFLAQAKELLEPAYPNLFLDSHAKAFHQDMTLHHVLSKGVDTKHLWMCNSDGSGTDGKMCGKCDKCYSVIQAAYQKGGRAKYAINRIRDKYYYFPKL